MNKQAVFKALCLNISLPIEERKILDDDVIEQKKSRPYETISNQRFLITDNWHISNICRGCKKHVSESDFVVWVGYWSSGWYPAHRECEKTGRAEEAFECQKIDADCNDCAHFQRGEKILVYGKQFNHTFGGWRGWCRKLTKPVIASANHCTGLSCFEHRKELSRVGDSCE